MKQRSSKSEERKQKEDRLFKALPIFSAALSNAEISEFQIKHSEGQGLVSYLCGFAESDEENSLMRTYIVRDCFTDEFVGYFSLKAGMISANEQNSGIGDSFDMIPGVELANFAVNSNYTEQHKEIKGYGLIIFEKLIIPIIEDAAKRIGIRLVYIFSLPLTGLMKRYEQYGFKRLSMQQEEKLHRRLKPNYDRNCIFMYQELN